MAFAFAFYRNARASAHPPAFSRVLLSLQSTQLAEEEKIEPKARQEVAL